MGFSVNMKNRRNSGHTISITNLLYDACLVAVAIVSSVSAARPPARGPEQIKRWDAKVEFNVTVDEAVHDPPLPENMPKVRQFLDSFTTYTLKHRDNVEFLSRNLNTEEKLEFSKRLHASDSSGNQIVAGSIWQDFDHFTDNFPGQYWLQHFYYTTDADGQPTGAQSRINFLMLEGEGGFSKGWISDTWAFVQWARQWNATAYTLEHRFYGDSALNSNTSIAVLKLLTADQALADAAVFIKNINQQMGWSDDSAQWIVFGGSYPGNLAAWMREKYPQLVRGAIASSAPVEAKADFYEYVQVVSEAFELYGPAGCSATIINFFTWAQEIIFTPSGRQALGICEPSSGNFTTYDAQLYFSNHIGAMSGAVQYDDIGHQQLATTCGYYSTLTAKLASFRANKKNSSLEVETSSSSCTSFNFVKDTQQFAAEPSLTYYWYWQTCNEFGYFQTSTRGTSAYSIYMDCVPVDFFVLMCEWIFGPEFDFNYVEQSANAVNEDFGGTSQFTGTNVVFLNGSEDPWHALSILTDIDGPTTTNGGNTTEVQSFLISGTSHCYDMYAYYSGEQNQGLYDAHAIAEQALSNWLS